MQELMSYKTIEGNANLEGSEGTPEDTSAQESSRINTYRSAERATGKSTFASVGSKYSKLNVKLIKESVHISTTPYRKSIDPTRLDASLLNHQKA